MTFSICDSLQAQVGDLEEWLIAAKTYPTEQSRNWSQCAKGGWNPGYPYNALSPQGTTMHQHGGKPMPFTLALQDGKQILAITKSQGRRQEWVNAATGEQIEYTDVAGWAKVS